MKSLLTIATLALVLGSASATALSLGNLLERDYGVYTSMPTTMSEAVAQGWGPLNGNCEPGLGVAYTQNNGSYPTEHKPLWLYFTPYGQASGVATLFLNHIEKEKKNLITLGYIVQFPYLPAGQYYVSVGFRSNTDSCSMTELSKPLGDRLVVHPAGIAHHLPLTATDAFSRGWVKGSCFAGMGTHWFRDLSSPGSMSWDANQLLPVVTMYDEESVNATNQINAIFFASTVVQQELIPPHENQWEPIPLPNLLMCKNFCNSSCTFHGTDFYSTLHVYMNDRSRVTCKGGCTIGCCGGTTNFDDESRMMRMKRIGRH